jgi:hypothetical protein
MINFYPNLPVGSSSQPTPKTQANLVAPSNATNNNREMHIRERRAMHNRRTPRDGKQVIDRRSGPERRRSTISFSV